MVAEGTVNLEKIKEMSYDEAKKELLKLSGIGSKVADCICLFALHKLDAFPVDTHIQKVIDTVYAGKFPYLFQTQLLSAHNIENFPSFLSSF